MSRKFPRLMVCTALSALALAGCAPKYKINVTPVWKVGQKFDYLCDASSTVKVSTRTDLGASDQNNKVVVHFEAQGEVIAVFPNGGIKQASYIVKVMNATANELPSGSMEAGTQVMMLRDDEKQLFTVNQKPPTPEQANFLSMVLITGKANNSDQKILEPKSTVAVSAQWPINTDALDNLQAGFKGTATATGQTKLVSVTGSGDNQVETVTGNFTMEGKLETLPATLHGELTVTVPATAKGVFKQENSMKIEARREEFDRFGAVSTTFNIQTNVAQSTTFH